MIREARLCDAAAIARVHVDTWLSTYRGLVPDEHLDSLCHERTERVTRQRLSDPQPGAFTLAAEAADGQVVGFTAAGPADADETGAEGKVYALYVLASHQRQGIGTALVTCAAHRLLKAGMRSMVIWVLRDNPARAFYERLGGTPAGAKIITIGGRDLEEVAYRWDDVETLVGAPDRPR